MKLWRGLLLLSMAGCGGAGKPVAEEPPASATEGTADAAAAKAPQQRHTCAEAEANVAAFTQHVSRTLAATVGARCLRDGWAQEVINCFAATQEGPDLGLCTALLTPEQQRALETQDVPDAVDPNAPPDPACAVLTGAAAAPAPEASPGAAGGATPATPVPLPTLGLPRGSASKAAGGAPAAAAPGAAATAPPAAPAQPRRTIAHRELERLRLSGETQLAPDPGEQRLMSRCRVTRVLASFKLCIDEAGAPSLVEPLRSSRLAGYDGKLLAVIRTWRYRHYLVEGEATEVCSAVTFVYAVK